MRLPWDRSKPSQLDLLAIEQPASIAEAPSKAPVPHAAAPSQEVPSVAAFARAALVAAARAQPLAIKRLDAPASRPTSTAKLHLRMNAREAELLVANARLLGLSYGEYVGRLVVASPLPAPIAERNADRAALRVSSDNLAVLAGDIMLSMPAGTKPEAVRQAAREFAKDELASHRYVMVLHTHQANPHVHLAVRAEGRDGQRLNPRKPDLRRWREVFAEKLRDLGIDAEASSRVVRGSRHRNKRLWERKTQRAAPARGDKVPTLTRSRRGAIQAWAKLTLALESSDDPSDRKLAQSIRGHLRSMPGVAEMMRQAAKQQELPGMSRTIDRSPERTRGGPEWER